jgi:hypothetical protein
MAKFVIEDWAGNHLFREETFETFQDGWDFIYQQFPDEEDLSDYYVVEFNKDKHPSPQTYDFSWVKDAKLLAFKESLKLGYLPTNDELLSLLKQGELKVTDEEENMILELEV